MDLLGNVYLFIALTVVFIVLTIFLFVQLKFKKREGKTLKEECSYLAESIAHQKKEFEDRSTELERRKAELTHLLELEQNESKLRNQLEVVTLELEQANEKITSLKEEAAEISDNIVSMKEDISIYQPVHDLMSVGFFEEPEYLFETSERFKEEIKIIRDQQKAMIKEGNAISIPEGIALTSNSAYAKKVLSGQSQLMLKAFNVECDNLMALVKPSNYANILERIDKVASDIEKSAASLQCGFVKEYVELKFKECEIQYQFKLKDAREKEEQEAIKEQMREEQKAIREFERALEKAQREEKMYKDALDEARKELSISGDKDTEKLNARIALLERQLQEAEENEKRAMSMAEQTRRGHVYIISNVGSFGDNVYKIGLTRRLEPIDRVKELGDASVPFSFDVHAMIYSEDAPALETQLHKEFTKLRVNQVNYRKEFFNVTLRDIKDKASEILGGEVDFKMTALAEEYYESLKLRGEIVQS
jgi:predicted RNase H-like nuclease (RuvC/YqgF family)